MVFNCSHSRNAGDPALSFPKCCLRELCVRTRSPDDSRKLHVKATRAVHKGCGQILVQVPVPLTSVITNVIFVVSCAFDLYTSDVSCLASRKNNLCKVAELRSRFCLASVP